MAVFRYSSRFWLYAPTALFAALAAAVMIHWWMVAGALEKKLAALKGREAVPGITLNWDKAEVGGFPFRLDANFVNFRLHGRAAESVSWRTEKLALHTLVYSRGKMVYEAAGQQWAQWSQFNGRGHTVSFIPGSMHASSIVDRAGLQRFDLDIVELRDNASTFDRFQFHVRRDPNGRALDVMLKADALQPRGPAPKAQLRDSNDRIEELPIATDSLTERGTGSKNLQIYANLDRMDLLIPLLRGERSWFQTMSSWFIEGEGRATYTQVKLPPGQSPQLLLSPLIYDGPKYY